MPCFIANVIHAAEEVATPFSVILYIITVLLKNLFTVHFQFDLLKLETNTCLDNCEMNSWLRRILLDHCGDELG